MLADTNDTPRTLEESYVCATNASDLTVDPNHFRPVDLIIASGLTDNKLGSYLKALRAEWDVCDKPRKHTEAEIQARAAQVPNAKGKPNVDRARTECLMAYARGMRARSMTLRGRPVVMEGLTAYAVMKGIDPDVVSLALYHWLSSVCPVCDGRGFRRLPDAPVLGKRCHHCGGSGKWPEPPGGEKIRDHIDYCVSAHNGGVSKRSR